MTTHMQSFGCFGSLLAFDEKAEPCASCPKHDECQTEVMRRRPNFLEGLSKRSTAKGESMDYYWLDKSEKKALRDLRKQRKLEAASLQIYGDSNFADNLKANTSSRSHSMIDTLVISRIDLRTATKKQIAVVDEHTAMVVGILEQGKQSMNELLASFQSQSSLSEATISSTVYAVISILRACGRVTDNNGKLEIIDA